MNAGERVYAAGQYFFLYFLCLRGAMHPAVINKLLLIMRVYGVQGHDEANGFRLTPPQ